MMGRISKRTSQGTSHRISQRTSRVGIGAVALGVLLLACTDSPTKSTPANPTLTLTVNALLTVSPGGSTTQPVTIGVANGTVSGPVTLSASEVPSGVTVSFSPAVLTNTVGTSTLTVVVAQDAVPGSKSFRITATPTGAEPASLVVLLTIPNGTELTTLGLGTVADRYTAEVWVRGTTAYTTTWGTRNGTGRGNAIKIWDVSANTPQLVDSLIVANASTIGDVQVSDDGTLLVAAVESNPNGGLAVYQLNSPRNATLLARTTGGELQYGVHTAEIARVNGVLYAFCAIDPANGVPARLVIVSLANPAQPTTVASLQLGAPYIHDVFVRDGLLFTAEWNDGIGIWDIGGGNIGGTIAVPKRISRLNTVGGQVHNVWWYHDPVQQTKRYMFIGQEGPGIIGSASTGDIHVVDVSNMAAPIEVARHTVVGAGVHNFSVDEAQGLLYAAYYNGGVRVLDVRGDLSTCTAAQKVADGRCDMTLMGRERARFTGTGPLYVWGVHWSASGVFASDMLNGLYRITPAAR